MAVVRRNPVDNHGECFVTTEMKTNLHKRFRMIENHHIFLRPLTTKAK